ALLQPVAEGRPEPAPPGAVLQLLRGLILSLFPLPGLSQQLLRRPLLWRLLPVLQLPPGLLPDGRLPQHLPVPRLLPAPLPPPSPPLPAPRGPLLHLLPVAAHPAREAAP